MDELREGYKNIKGIGWIPNDWNVKSLGELCNKITDGTHKTPKYVLEGVKFISAKNIINGKIDWSDIKYITNEEHEILIKRCNPEDGDILLAKSGTLGIPAIIKKSFEFSLFESLALIKYKRDKINGEYLFQYLSSPIMSKIYHLETKGLSIKHLHLTEINKFKIIVPKKLEQEKIAEILSTFNEVITKTEQLIKEKKVIKKGLMQQLLTGKKRLKGFEQQEWKEVKLGSVLKFKKKQALTNPQEYYLLTVKLHLKGIEATNNKPNKTEKSRPYYLREPNELLIGRQNFHNGGIGIVPNGMIGYIASNAISSLETKKGDLKFYYYYLSYDSFYKKIGNMIGGTGQKEISEAMLNKLKLIIPASVEEQQAIANILTTADKEISLLEEKLEILREQKKGLMQDLLTGKVRVKV